MRRRFFENLWSSDFAAHAGMQGCADRARAPHAAQQAAHRARHAHRARPQRAARRWQEGAPELLRRQEIQARLPWPTSSGEGRDEGAQEGDQTAQRGPQAARPHRPTHRLTAAVHCT